MRPLLSTLCGLSVEPVSVSRFIITMPALIVAIGAALNGDDDAAAVLLQELQVLGQVVARHHVEHDVDAARQLLHLGRPVIVLVEDGVVGAQFAYRLGFVFIAHRREHRGAERLGELDRRRADAARAAMDQHALAGLELAALEEIVPDGEVVLRQRRRAQHVEALGDGRHCGAGTVQYSA